MLILISPAKSMDNRKKYDVDNTSTPRFEREAEVLVDLIQGLSGDEIEKIFKVSSPLAISTFERYKNYYSADRNPAILSYTGTVFKGINATQFSQSELDYTQNHLRIISVLYGLLRPLDLIAEYRLEYKQKIGDIRLYDYWKPLLTKTLIEDTKRSGGVLINLGSLDLLPALNMGDLCSEVRVVNIEFKSLKNGKYTNIQTYSKIARGAITHYLLKNKISDVEQIKNFSQEGYNFNPGLSEENTLVFTK